MGPRWTQAILGSRAKIPQGTWQDEEWPGQRERRQRYRQECRQALGGSSSSTTSTSTEETNVRLKELVKSLKDFVPEKAQKLLEEAQDIFNEGEDELRKNIKTEQVAINKQRKAHTRVLRLREALLTKQNQFAQFKDLMKQQLLKEQERFNKETEKLKDAIRDADCRRTTTSFGRWHRRSTGTNGGNGARGDPWRWPNRSQAETRTGGIEAFIGEGAAHVLHIASPVEDVYGSMCSAAPDVGCQDQRTRCSKARRDESRDLPRVTQDANTAQQAGRGRGYGRAGSQEVQARWEQGGAFPLVVSMNVPRTSSGTLRAGLDHTVTEIGPDFNPAAAI